MSLLSALTPACQALHVTTITRSIPERLGSMRATSTSERTESCLESKSGSSFRGLNRLLCWVK